MQAQCVKNTFYWFNQQKRTEPSRGRTRAECWVLRHMTCRVVTCYAPQASSTRRSASRHRHPLADKLHEAVHCYAIAVHFGKLTYPSSCPDRPGARKRTTMSHSKDDYLQSFAHLHEKDVKSYCHECWQHVLKGEECLCNPPKSFATVESNFEAHALVKFMAQDKLYEESNKNDSPTKGHLDWSKCTYANAEKHYGISKSLVDFFRDRMNDTWYQANKVEWDKYKDVIGENPWNMLTHKQFLVRYNAVKQGDRGLILDYIFRRVLDTKVAENCKEFLKSGAYH